MDVAKHTDLLGLLPSLGYTLKRIGSYYTTAEMDSIRIRDPTRWKRYSTGQGGDAITFLQEFCGMRFPEAVDYLLAYHGRSRDSPDRDKPVPRPKPPPPREKPPFVLPPANPDQRRVFAYLRKRGIAAQVIQRFIDAGLLYEDAQYHNCVFVGRDGSGQPRFASKRGTCDLGGSGFKRDVLGSDKKIGFRLPCDPEIEEVAVFEAPIDLMSFCTLCPEVHSNAVALCGLYSGSLDTYLRDHPHLKSIKLLLDNDGPGIAAAKEMRGRYREAGYEVEIRVPKYGKDWNAQLMYKLTGVLEEVKKPQKNKNPTQKEESNPMANLGKIISDKSTADAKWREERQADKETAAALRDASVIQITKDPGKFARYLELQGDNPSYSSGNIALAMAQLPEATVVHTRGHWKDLGRFVLDPELKNGASIFTRSATGRGYNLTSVYDIAQTQGRELRTPQLRDDTEAMEPFMNEKHHSLRTRLTALLLALVCVLSLFPTTAFAASDTITLKEFGHSGVAYESAALGRCTLHEMTFKNGNKDTTGFCGTKGGDMGSSLQGQTWGNKRSISDPTVEIMMAYYYAHSTGVFTDEAEALGVADVWSGGYRWYMNAWVQACIWRYQQGTMSDPVVACAEELMAVYNTLEGTHYTSIDQKQGESSFRDRTQFILDLGSQGVWGKCAVYEYTFTGAGSSAHPAGSVQKIILGDLTVEHIEQEEYVLIVKKVDATNPSKGLPGAGFHIESTNGSYSKDVVTGQNGTYRISGLSAGTYAVTETSAPEGYEIDSAAPQYVTLDQAAVNGGGTVTVTASDKKLPNLTILKRDAKTGDVIPDTHFEINGIHYGLHHDVTTGPDGTATLTGIPVDSYEVTEISVPDPYVVSDEPTQTIWLEAGDSKQLIFDNQKQPLLKITKIEKGTNQPIPGTVFLLEAIDGDYRHEVTTEASGSTELRVAPGSYRITEQSVPEPYCISDEPTQTISLNGGDEKEVIFQNLKKPELTISKIDADSGKPVPGTVFTVKAINGDYQDDWTTGADGKVSLRITPGTYQITEKSVPAPYYLPDKDMDRVQTISLNPGDEKTLVFRNHKAPELTIFKEDSVAGAPIEGAKFHVTYTSNGESADAPASVDFGYFITDANGEIKLHEKGKKLYPGEYTVTEVEPAPGFQMKEPTTQKVIIRGGESKTLTFQNEPLNGIVVEKYDSVTGEALLGCTFQLRYLGGTSGTGGTVIGQKVTGKNGTAIWTGLTAGTYIVEEVDPADGYSIIKSSETVYISDDGVQNVITVTFDNAPDGLLLIRKVCSVNPSITLQDAEFKVTYADGTLIGDSNGIYRTDENGEIRISGLKPGKSVIVTETKAPAGFLIDTQSQTIQIKEGRTVSLTFKNQPTGKLIVQKRDSVSGQPLPGAQFRVTTAAGCEVGLDGVIGTATLTQNGLFTTDSNGEIRISNLAPGAYVLTEIKAPAVFLLEKRAVEHFITQQDGLCDSIVYRAGEHCYHYKSSKNPKLRTAIAASASGPPPDGFPAEQAKEFRGILVWSPDGMERDMKKEADAQKKTPGSSAIARGSFRLSTPSRTGAAAGSAPTPSVRSCGISTITTRTCGPGCWNSRPFLERRQKNSTALSASRTSTPSSGRRIRTHSRAPHEVQDKSSGR